MKTNEEYRLLEQQLANATKQNMLLRDAIDSAINGLRWWMDAFPMHVTEADNEEMLELVKALDDTADLAGLVVCDAVPVGAVLVRRDTREGIMFYSNDMIPDKANIKDRFELVTVYSPKEKS